MAGISVAGRHLFDRRFELVGHSSVGQSSAAHSSATRVIFDHTGFPSELAEHLESGWRENYWNALRKYLA